MPNAHSQIFIAVMGSHHESELFTSLVRLVHEAIAKGYQVTVWVCGGATALTLASLGDTKVRNVMDVAAGVFDIEYPSTAALVKELLETSEGRLRWLICRHCMQDRGTTNQIDEVKIIPPYKFMHFVKQADSSLIMGVF